MINSNDIKQFFSQFDENPFNAHQSFFDAHMGYIPNPYWECEHSGIEAAFAAHGWPHPIEHTIDALKKFNKRFSKKIKAAKPSRKLEKKIEWAAKVPDEQDIYRFFLKLGGNAIGVYNGMLELYVHVGVDPNSYEDADRIHAAMVSIGWDKGFNETQEALKRFVETHKAQISYTMPDFKVRVMDARLAAKAA